MPLNEADTCTRLVVPRLRASGWDDDPHSFTEQYQITDGRIVVIGQAHRRKQPKRADYLLRYTRDVPLAVVEAKSEDRPATEGVQQAKQYAELLGLMFAYATNGTEIIEFDYLAGTKKPVEQFPTPAELWQRIKLRRRLVAAAEKVLLEPFNQSSGKVPRYYQRLAIERALAAILAGEKRVLLTLATGTGKTLVAFQICWKLSEAKWNANGQNRRPRILFLADRNVLVDEPKAKDFAIFGDARWKIENGEAKRGREMYFAIYQSIAKDERRPGLYKQYPRDYFDLIVVDECHRGSASDDSNWREILEWFQPAYQLGMTATPKRQDNIDTYAYFGDAVYTYSLRQGIDDGFLAPFRVHRVITTWDAVGWRPSQGDMDRYGRPIPDEEYHTRDFERVVALRKRTQAIARHLSGFMRAYDRYAKTIVFCVDQEHAAEMRQTLINCSSDLVQQYPDYAVRVTADEGDQGMLQLGSFKDVEKLTPVIVTTSQLLTTGVDIPTCKNVVLCRVINSMTEFKQIIGRGTRVKEDAGKTWFNIIDYTGSATRLFADPEFDGDPVGVTQTEVDEDGETTAQIEEQPEPAPGADNESSDGIIEDAEPSGRRKFYYDGGAVEIAAHVVYELDADGTQLRAVKLTDYAADRIRTMVSGASELLSRWTDPQQRTLVISELADRGINLEQLAEAAGRPDADPFDLLCHLAFNAPLRTRRERAERLKRDKHDLFDQYGPKAREILDVLLEKYAKHGLEQFKLPDVLQMPPISGMATLPEVVAAFGGADHLRLAVGRLATYLYRT